MIVGDISIYEYLFSRGLVSFIGFGVGKKRLREREREREREIIKLHLCFMFSNRIKHKKELISM